MIPIPKTATPSLDPSKYRPITLLPVIFKIFESLLQKRLSKWLEENSLLAEAQAGFRHKRGIYDSLSVVRILSENAAASHTPLYFGLLDTQKAFDTVWREKLFHKLYKDNINPRLLHLIMACYNSSQISIKTNAFIGVPFHTTLGVLQGSVLSPTLYIYYINNLLVELEQVVSSLCTNTRAFADDILLIADKFEILIELLLICANYSNTHHFCFNVVKSLFFLFDQGQTLCKKFNIHNLQGFLDALNECRSQPYCKFFSGQTDAHERVHLAEQILAHSNEKPGPTRYLIKWLTHPDLPTSTSWEEPPSAYYYPLGFYKPGSKLSHF
jgi:hypothetical protein